MHSSLKRVIKLWGRSHFYRCIQEQCECTFNNFTFLLKAPDQSSTTGTSFCPVWKQKYLRAEDKSSSKALSRVFPCKIFTNGVPHRQEPWLYCSANDQWSAIWCPLVAAKFVQPQFQIISVARTFNTLESTLHWIKLKTSSTLWICKLYMQSL